MDKVYVHANRASASAALLCRSLRANGVKARRLRGERVPRHNWPIINYGDTSLVAGRGSRIVNRPESVATAINKFNTAQCLDTAGVATISVTRDKAVAKRWWDGEHGVLSRRDGLSNGRGIAVWSADAQPDAEFYTRYFPKTHEYRVHVFGDSAIDLVEKRARTDAKADRTVRSHDNGWVFAHSLSLSHADDIAAINRLALQACRAVGLDFGAVDILAVLTKDMPRRLRKAVVCEINTGPGLENTRTIMAYVKAIKEQQ